MEQKYTEIKANSITGGEKEHLKIGYFADGEWSHQAFDKLILDKSISISFICVRFDSQDEKLKQYCDEYDIDYLKHENINSDEFISKIKTYKCDLLVSMSFNQIFKKEIINICPLKAINVHAGKLPFYRGRNILNWVLINDEKEFGITSHYIDEGIDTGDIIIQRVYKIDDSYTYKTLIEISFKECANILYDSVKLLQKTNIQAIKQDTINDIGFYCTKRNPDDTIINWNQTSREIFNFIRSICKPTLMAKTFLNSKEMKINKSIEIKDAPKYKGISGAILNKDKDGFLVKTNDSFIKIVEFEFDGKIKVGDRLG